MGKINLLAPGVFNMIAAGEVVERPASVVKELVENSIDAGADEIEIYIEQGGISRIRVSDNGIGILPEDMKSAFLPHATSKLKNIEDLDDVSTLGFRGEALASIASVSEVTLASASKSAGSASKIVLSGGNVVSESVDNRAHGTVISVDNLFFNTPARLKFLKNPSGEQHYVVDSVKALVLANPNVSITLRNEEGILVSGEGGALLDAIYSVYDSKTADKLLKVDSISKNGITVRGYVSSVDFVKANRTYQTIIVNGRIVKDSTITAAVEKAYSGYLMRRCYPVFVLDVLVPFDSVDVNVHPSKTEVRFRDKNSVFSAFYHAVADVLDENSEKLNIGGNTLFKANESNESDSKAALNDASNGESLPENNSQAGESTFAAQKYVQARIDTSSIFHGKSAPKSYGFGLSADADTPASYKLNERAITVDSDFTHSWKSREDYPDVRQSRSIPTVDFCEATSDRLKKSDFDSNLNNANVICGESNSETLFIKTTDGLSNVQSSFDGKIVGQIFDTYIIVERDGQVLIIDQHAAHERILYDKIVKRFCAEYSQPLLAPYICVLSGEESEFIDSVSDELNALGFSISCAKEGQYLIEAVPEPISRMDFKKLLEKLFTDISAHGEISVSEILKDSLCQQACKAAIKGGEHLSREQLEAVIKNYTDENGDLPSKCPHGRPAVAAFSKRDVEKMFKRIV